MMTGNAPWKCNRYRESSIGHCAMFDFRLLDQLANVDPEDDGKGQIDLIPEPSNVTSNEDTETDSCQASSKSGKQHKRPISGIAFSDKSAIACVRDASSVSSIRRPLPHVSPLGSNGARGVATTEIPTWYSVRSTVAAIPTGITTYGSTWKTSAVEADFPSWYIAPTERHANRIKGSMVRQKSPDLESTTASTISAGTFNHPAVYHGGPALDVALP